MQDAYPFEHPILIDNSLLFIINMPGLLERFVNMFRAALDEKFRKLMRPLPSQDTQSVLKMARYFFLHGLFSNLLNFD